LRSASIITVDSVAEKQRAPYQRSLIATEPSASVSGKSGNAASSLIAVASFPALALDGPALGRRRHAGSGEELPSIEAVFTPLLRRPNGHRASANRLAKILKAE